jgi:hypothetical protein
MNKTLPVLANTDETTLKLSIAVRHRWALSPISVISYIGLSLISEPLILDRESEVRHYVGYQNKVLSDICYLTRTGHALFFRLRACAFAVLGEALRILFLALNFALLRLRSHAP